MGWTDALIAILPAMLVSAVLIGLERARGGAPGDMLRNLQCWGLQLLIGFTVLAHVAWPLHWSLLDGRRLPLWLGLAIFLIARDFGEYMFHRAQHRIPLLWAMHSLHHSDPDMQALTTERHFWGDQLIKNLTIWPATFVVISPTTPILAGFGIAMLWNFVVHSGLPIDFGRWSFLLNSPAYHRRHHSIHPEHYDSNFAALLPIFDVILGSYNRPHGYPETGLPHRPASLAELVAWPLIWDDPERRRGWFTRARADTRRA